MVEEQPDKGGGRKELSKADVQLKESEGIAQRAQMDIETIRFLVLINGGGLVALATLLAVLIEAHEMHFVPYVLISAGVLVVGVVVAVIGNMCRRQCSLDHWNEWEKGKKLDPPTDACVWSSWCMYISTGAFSLAAVFVVLAGMIVFWVPSVAEVAG